MPRHTHVCLHVCMRPYVGACACVACTPKGSTTARPYTGQAPLPIKPSLPPRLQLEAARQAGVGGAHHLLHLLLVAQQQHAHVVAGHALQRGPGARGGQRAPRGGVRWPPACTAPVGPVPVVAVHFVRCSVQSRMPAGMHPCFTVYSSQPCRPPSLTCTLATMVSTTASCRCASHAAAAGGGCEVLVGGRHPISLLPAERQPRTPSFSPCLRLSLTPSSRRQCRPFPRPSPLERAPRAAP